MAKQNQESGFTNLMKETFRTGSLATAKKTPPPVESSSLPTTQIIFKSKKYEDFIPSQNYEDIKKKYSNKNRFVDTEFSTCDKSLYHSKEYRTYLLDYSPKLSNKAKFVWIRAKDLVQNPQFAIEDKTNEAFSPLSINEKNYRKYFLTTDVDQGSIGNLMLR